MVRASKTFVAGGALVFMLSYAQSASAQQAGGFVPEIPHIDNYVAGAVGVLPDYVGSDDYTWGVAPAAFFSLGDSERYVKLLINELSVNILDNESWSFGPKARYRFGRDDNSIDDDVVSRMKDIDDTIEAGVFVGWKWVGDDDPRHRFMVTADVFHDVTGEHGGYVAAAQMAYFHPVWEAITLSAGLATSYSSEDYMQTYFGVDGVDAARSGLPFFNADGGFRDVRASVAAIFSFSPNWHIGTGVVYSRLLGDAKDSPIVDQRGSADQFIAGAGLAYAW